MLILHTHGTESYLPDGADSYDEDESFRSENTEENVVAVGRVFADTLRGAGISVIHDETMYDRDDFNAAYTSSRAAVYDWLEKYPSIRYVFDLHRDSVFTADGENQKPVAEIGGETAAQIMLVVGHRPGRCRPRRLAAEPDGGRSLPAASQRRLPHPRPSDLSADGQLQPAMPPGDAAAGNRRVRQHADRSKRAARLAALSFISLYDSSMS